MSGRLSAAEALQRLKRGNERFVSGADDAKLYGPPDERGPVRQQEPIAIILGCSDARVPAEMVFDQGVGDLFVIRVAGNIVAPSQVGSIEFAASQFGTRLVVVLGHTLCGAVIATINELCRDETARTPGLRAIVDRVRPSVESLVSRSSEQDPDALLSEAVRANIMASVRQLREGSELIRELMDQEGLQIVGAEYSLQTGVVELLEGEG
ncbi:MAG: carbonic anhydrase [Xanthomonadales bacterium]|nr:carbonic anhydrase [Xanthomonadales bacterium]